MSEIVEQPPESPTGSSRRAALKAGVGVGVGLLAWSGPTITSLGGTPAYALGCTFVVRVNISGVGGCRNTDQGCDPYGYHTLNLGVLPAGYSISPNIPEGTCCTVNHAATLTFPTGITCTLVIRFANPPQCSLAATIGTLVFGPAVSPIPITFSCAPGITSNDQYQVNLTCNTTGADPGCLT